MVGDMGKQMGRPRDKLKECYFLPCKHWGVTGGLGPGTATINGRFKEDNVRGQRKRMREDTWGAGARPLDEMRA